MPSVRTPKAKRSASHQPLSDSDFAAQLAELNASFARIAADLPPTRPATPQGKVPSPARGAAAEPERPAAIAPVAVTAQGLAKAEATVSNSERVEAAPTPTRPVGTDLADPKNFGQLPPLADLEQGGVPADEFRHRLSRHLEFATRVLHTSGVPAAVWREWRGFEKAVRQRLQLAAD